MIDSQKLQELVKLMVDNDLTELDLQDEKETVTIKRGSAAPVVQYAAHAPAAPAAAPAAGAPAPAVPVNDDAGLVAIESPMVGTCYLGANPDSPAFVKPGSSISADTVVCLVEAMKVFNEIKAEKTGKIERVLVKNGQAVEFGQKLFLVRP